MFEVWLQMSDTNIDRENPSDLPALPSTLFTIYNTVFCISKERLVQFNAWSDPI